MMRPSEYYEKRLLEALEEAVFMNEQRPPMYRTIMPKAYIACGKTGNTELLDMWKKHVTEAKEGEE